MLRSQIIPSLADRADSCTDTLDAHTTPVGCRFYGKKATCTGAKDMLIPATHPHQVSHQNCLLAYQPYDDNCFGACLRAIRSGCRPRRAGLTDVQLHMHRPVVSSPAHIGTFVLCTICIVLNAVWQGRIWSPTAGCWRTVRVRQSAHRSCSTISGHVVGR